MLKFLAYGKNENFKKIWYKYFPICFAVHLFSSLGYAQLWSFGGTCVCLTSSPCYSIGFCIDLCVVLALNSQALQSEACISIANYERSPFFWKLSWNNFQIIFTENEMKQKRKENTLTSLKVFFKLESVLLFVFECKQVCIALQCELLYCELFLPSWPPAMQHEFPRVPGVGGADCVHGERHAPTLPVRENLAWRQPGYRAAQPTPYLSEPGLSVCCWGVVLGFSGCSGEIVESRHWTAQPTSLPIINQVCLVLRCESRFGLAVRC